MSTSLVTSSCALPPHLAAWRSLVSRSISAWDDLSRADDDPFPLIRSILEEESRSLDDFLGQGTKICMFWFFQRRSAFTSQKRMKKWSRDALDDYIILPASSGFVTRADCFFISHFWRTPQNPDPDGENLRLHQANFESQTWSYVWVDWTCMPQSPRSVLEETYFHRCLQTMSAIIRNCGFAYFYPPFEPRLWILYEITEFVLTSSGGFPKTSDIEVYFEHIDEMLKAGVQATLAKHGYCCSFHRDRQYLTSWLELLVLLKRLPFDICELRDIMNRLTWSPFAEDQYHVGLAILKKFEGTLTAFGKTYTFTPFPQWDHGKYSQGKPI
ncbi:hypothetical protein BDW02DRAFT_568554 [Decorospora gaudefroyi]|uniref:Heterokaryon incompatibility domain-containing protein n=1 Tax=Decorospora gaudefroyi TaxID=184978 RepID=A0A6A5KFC1_9PLEO|nr:hypothetical protein BDW02DRAFT_568554 [Decorospora gaudefroyi]